MTRYTSHKLLGSIELEIDRGDLVDRAVRECSDRMHALHAPQGEEVAS